MRLVYETHMHTTLCKHAIGSLEDYAEMAYARGLKGMIVTCHCPMPKGFNRMIRMSDKEWPIYLRMVRQTAQRWQGKLDVRLGLESEFFPGQEPYIESLHQREPLQYVLGSVHCHMGIYRKTFDTHDARHFQTYYFTHLADAAETGLYDCISHPDLIKNEYSKTWNVDDLLQDVIAPVLDRVAATGVAMELNTSGVNKSVAEMNPGRAMLELMRERDIPVTVGADAHNPSRVADGFEEAFQTLMDVGYTELSYFLNRERHTLTLQDALDSLRPVEPLNVY
jgi:histidinol-phosphatase (PHP family)